MAGRAEGRGVDPTSELLHPPYSHSTDDCWAHDPPTEKQLPRVDYVALALIEEPACGTLE
jgi:hypothetical protein